MVRSSAAQLAQLARARSVIGAAAGRVQRHGSLGGDAAPAAARAHGEAAAVQEVSCEVAAPLAEVEALLSLHAACRSAPLDGMGSSDGTPDFRPIFMGSSRWAVTAARLYCPPEAVCPACRYSDHS